MCASCAMARVLTSRHLNAVPRARVPQSTQVHGDLLNLISRCDSKGDVNERKTRNTSTFPQKVQCCASALIVHPHRACQNGRCIRSPAASVTIVLTVNMRLAPGNPQPKPTTCVAQVRCAVHARKMRIRTVRQKKHDREQT